MGRNVAQTFRFAVIARESLDRVLDSRLIVPLSCASSMLLGLWFIFVWAPHPWGWYGIDQYHQLAVGLAEGRPFPTMDVPWGYAYFLAFFYRVFGPHPIPALVAQVLLNALVPPLVYRYARQAFDRRVAAVAALVVGLFSFNTVYASTESSDSVCTLLFIAAVVVFADATRQDGLARFALCGALCGGAAQFRPNLILLPVVFAALHLLRSSHTRRALGAAAVAVAAACATLAPWTIRNFRLTGEIIPTSTHGGVQLWYGTLQAGQYLDSRAHNPRSLFEAPAFEYTSLVNVPILVQAHTQGCAPTAPQSVELVYWTDRTPSPMRIALSDRGQGRYGGMIPAQPDSRVLKYYFDLRWSAPPAEQPARTTPAGGPSDPFVYFLSGDHMSDLDTADDLLDVFDLIRLIRHIAWAEPVRAAAKLDLDRSGRLDEIDLHDAVRLLLLNPLADPADDPHLVEHVAARKGFAEVRFVDGSRLLVPQPWRGAVTDLGVTAGTAASLLHTRRRFAAPDERRRVPMPLACLGLDHTALNNVFYRVQPHEMRRYTALAWDNIRRAPGAYVSSVIYRAVRLFVVRGTEDRATAQQFRGSRLVYRAASVGSAVYLLLFLAGAVVAVRRRYDVWLPLSLIAYIPATIAWVLTNMRYTVTVQPLMLIFVAVTLVAVLDRWSVRGAVSATAAATRNPAGRRTTLRP